MRVAVGRVVAPFSVGALVTGSLKDDAVSPTDPSAGERVRLVVVTAVDCLPSDVPPDLRSLLETSIDRGAKVRRPETCLCSRVADHGDAVTDDSGPEGGAVCFPVLPGQRAQEPKCHAARMCLGQGSVVVPRDGHYRSGDANRRSNAVDLPY